MYNNEAQKTTEAMEVLIRKIQTAVYYNEHKDVPRSERWNDY